MDLANGALGPGRSAGLELRPDALIGPATNLFLAQEVDDGLSSDRIVPATRLAIGTDALGQADQGIGTRSTNAVNAARPSSRDHLTLTREGGVGDLPAIANRTNAL